MGKKITDTELGKRLNIPYQTIMTWKKTKIDLYNHLRAGFELQSIIDELKPKADKYDEIIKVIEQ